MSEFWSTKLVCAGCRREYSELEARALCECGALLDAVHRPPNVVDSVLRLRYSGRSLLRSGHSESGVWRYQDMVMPSATELVSHPEGNTPLLDRARIASWVGASRLSIKHEGHNPTGSFKDRGMTVALTQAKRIRARAVACASTGNTSASLAAYAALAEIPAVVVIPEGNVALGKLAQTIAYGARTLLVKGNFDDCLRLVREASEKLGVYLVNSVNPWRVEGQKTIVFELLQQLGWDAPDWIALPAGNLGNTAAFGKALREARALGLIQRTPRLLCVQAAGAAPFAASFERGFTERMTVKPETLATAIKIGDPASYERAVLAIRETNGVVTAASDDEILAAKAVIDASGVGCEPASAASVAGVKKLVSSGVIGRDERVVAVLTGHVLKDPGIILRYHQETEPRPEFANRPVVIDATLAAFERAALRETAS